MSAGKLAAQCCHASEAFLTSHLRDRANVPEVTDETGELCYRAEYIFSKEVYEDWICGIFTKTVCEAKNRNHLLKAKTMVEELGLEEGKLLPHLASFSGREDLCKAPGPAAVR